MLNLTVCYSFCWKSDQKRRRSSSSSSSSSSKSQKLETHDKSELKDEEFHKTKPCQRESTVPAQGGRPLGDFVSSEMYYLFYLWTHFQFIFFVSSLIL